MQPTGTECARPEAEVGSVKSETGDDLRERTLDFAIRVAKKNEKQGSPGSVAPGFHPSHLTLHPSPMERIQQGIYLLRGEKVILSHDLALLYGVPTKALVQAVKRNRERFPADFMFQLTAQASTYLKSQFVTSSWGDRREVQPLCLHCPVLWLGYWNPRTDVLFHESW